MDYLKMLSPNTKTKLKVACLIPVLWALSISPVYSWAGNRRIAGAKPDGGGGAMNKDDTCPLKLAISVSQKTCRADEDIDVEVVLSNQSLKPIYLYSPLEWGESASISIWLKDADTGKEVGTTFIADAQTPPPRSKDDFVRILGNHLFGVKYKVSLKDFDLKKGKRYDLFAEYHSPVPKQFGFGLAIWSREMGTVASKAARISIKD